MAIPIAQQTVMPDRTQATTPEELHPVAAAFGGDIGAALQQGGEQIASRIETLSLHMARMNYYRGEAQRADLLNNYKTQLQTKLYGDPSDPNATVTSIGGNVMPPSGQLSLSAGPSPSNVTPTAEPVEIPSGVYNRKGYAAAGALQDVDQWHQQTSQQILQQANGLGLRNNAVLKSQMDNAWSSERMGIVKHEATQIDQAQQQTFFKGMQLDADNAVTKQDPVSLGRAIDSINDTNKMLNDSQGKDDNDPIRELTSNKFISQALNNSMTANLKSTGGDPTQFQGTLDRLHDDGKINDTVYDNASEHLDRTSKAVIQQNERAAKVTDIKATLGYVNQVISGKVDFNNPNTINEIRSNSPTAGAAIDNYTLNKSVSVKPDDEAIAKSVDELYKTGSKEQIAKFNVGLMQKFPNGIPQDVVNTMLADGIDRDSRSADLEKEQQSPNAVQTRIDGGMQALQRWNKMQGSQDGQSYVDYMKNIKNKMAPMDAYNDAIRNSLIRKNPEVATIDPEKMPNQLVTASKGMSMLTANKSDAETAYHIKDGQVSSGSGEAPKAPHDGWVMMKDSKGNKAWVSPDKKDFEAI